MVTASKNTVHSVFFLILDFISISCLFIMIGAEFLGMIMLIVYVGAVAVLFLFVVMMLNVAQQKNQWFLSKSSSRHIPIGLIISAIIFFELIIVVGGWKYKPDLSNSTNISSVNDITNTMGSNLRLPELSATVAYEQLLKSEKLVSDRVILAEKLNTELANVDGFHIPKVRENCTHVYYMWQARVDSEVIGVHRDVFAKALNALGLYISFKSIGKSGIFCTEPFSSIILSLISLFHIFLLES